MTDSSSCSQADLENAKITVLGHLSVTDLPNPPKSPLILQKHVNVERSSSDRSSIASAARDAQTYMEGELLPRISAIDSLVAQLRRNRMELLNKNAEMETFQILHKRLGTTSLIRDTMPNEILTEIFTAYLDLTEKEVHSSFSSSAGLLLLTQVCHRWRETAIGRSRFWARIKITNDRDYTKNLKELTDLWLIRSVDESLSISVHDGKIADKTSMQEAMRNLIENGRRRWETLCVDGGGIAYDTKQWKRLGFNPLKDASYSLVRLKGLTLLGFAGGHAPGPEPPHTALFRNAPALTHLTADARHIFEKYMLPHSSITHLQLMENGPNFPSSSMSVNFFITSILPSFSAIVVCKVTFGTKETIRERYNFRPEPVVHSTLQRLFLYLRYPSVAVRDPWYNLANYGLSPTPIWSECCPVDPRPHMEELFDLMTLPALKSLTFDCGSRDIEKFPIPERPLASFLERSKLEKGSFDITIC